MNSFRVALLIEENREIGRSLLRGIAQYARAHGPWIFYREAPFYEKLSMAERIRRIRGWHPDGIIMREQGVIDRELLDMGIPVVFSAHRRRPVAGIPNILGNDQQIGIMAAEDLIHRGFRYFGFCGFKKIWWSEDRGRYFIGQIRKAGLQVDSLELSAQRTSEYSDRLAGWIRSLPQPCAVFACTDDLCRQIAEICKLAGIHVPEQVALLGVDNDELVCEFASPPLSSIVLNAEKSGYEAAFALHRMMQGERVGEIAIPIPAPRIKTRQSTDIVAVDDPAVASALNYIREHDRKGGSVEDIARASGVSRRVLEMRFRKTLGRSVYEEVLQVRMNRACKLLVESHLSVAQIAEELNYDEISYFSRAFRQVIGVSPMAYRKQNRIQP